MEVSGQLHALTALPPRKEPLALIGWEAGLTPYTDEITGVLISDFDIIDQLLIIYSAFVRYWIEKWEYNGRVHPLAHDSGETYCATFTLNLVDLYNYLG
jgi:hypothetical protein